MEVRARIKNTEVGPIPEDWDVVPLSSLCHTISDGTHFTPRYVARGVPFYSVGNVTANDFSNTKFISETEHSLLVRRCKPERGDILMTRIGSLGATKLLNWDVKASIYVSLALLRPNERVNTDLARKPRECLEYIVVHEMAHLLIRRHNEQFGILMDRHLPNWRQLRLLLNSTPLAHTDWVY